MDFNKVIKTVIGIYVIFIQYIDYTCKYIYRLNMYKKPLLLMQYTALRSILSTYIDPEDVYKGSLILFCSEYVIIMSILPIVIKLVYTAVD